MLASRPVVPSQRPASALPRASSAASNRTHTLASCKRKEASGNSNNAHRTSAVDVSVILTPRPEVIRRIPPPHTRRPNTAGLRDHNKLWSLEKLQSIVTRNGIGSAAWQCTYKDMDLFGALRAARSSTAAAAQDSDEEDETEQEAARRRRIQDELEKVREKQFMRDTSGPAAAEAAPVSRLLPNRFSYAELPREAALLRCLRAASGLLVTSKHPRRLEALDVLREIVRQPEHQKNETRSPGVTVKVVGRSTVADKMQALGTAPDTADVAIRIFKDFACGDTVVVAPMMLDAIDYCREQSAETLVKLILRSLGLLKATAHCAELHSAVNLVHRTAVETVRAASLAASKSLRAAVCAARSGAALAESSRGKDTFIVTEQQCDAEFHRLVQCVLEPKRPPVSSSPAASTSEPSFPQVVDAVKWPEMRSVILTHAAEYPILHDIILTEQL